MENKVAGSYDRNHYGTTLRKNLLHPGGIPDENIFNLSFYSENKHWIGWSTKNGLKNKPKQESKSSSSYLFTIWDYCTIVITLGNFLYFDQSCPDFVWNIVEHMICALKHRISISKPERKRGENTHRSLASSLRRQYCSGLQKPS